MLKSKKQVAYNLPWPSPTFYDSWNLWLAYRRERSLPAYRPIGLNALFTRLVRLSGDKEEIAIQIIEQSIEQNWQGLHKLKVEEVTAGFRGMGREALISEMKAVRSDMPREMLNAFYQYWTQPADNKQMLFQIQRAWDTGARLRAWYDRELKSATKGQPAIAQTTDPQQLNTRELRDRQAYEREFGSQQPE